MVLLCPISKPPRAYFQYAIKFSRLELKNFFNFNKEQMTQIQVFRDEAKGNGYSIWFFDTLRIKAFKLSTSKECLTNRICFIKETSKSI